MVLRRLAATTEGETKVRERQTERPVSQRPGAAETERREIDAE